jgi:hypothetical protein
MIGDWSYTTEKCNYRTFERKSYPKGGKGLYLSPLENMCNMVAAVSAKRRMIPVLVAL